jgi:hypothetical protein
MDSALIEKCADPFLNPALVQKFIADAGSADPLAVTVAAGGRLILVPKAVDPEQAMSIVRQYVGHAVVRVGLTQLPAGIGAKTAEDLDPALLEACRNLTLGTALFAKVLRIVAKWYGNPDGEEAARLIFEDAVLAWKTGLFEGTKVFAAGDPGGALVDKKATFEEGASQEPHGSEEPDASLPAGGGQISGAAMRIDLTRLGVKN